MEDLPEIKLYLQRNLDVSDIQEIIQVLKLKGIYFDQFDDNCDWDSLDIEEAVDFFLCCLVNRDIFYEVIKVIDVDHNFVAKKLFEKRESILRNAQKHDGKFVNKQYRKTI